MANNTDTILAITFEEGVRDGASSIPPQPDKFVVPCMCYTRGYSGVVEVLVDPNDSASTMNNALKAAVAAEVALQTGRSFAAVNVRLAGGFV